MQQKLWMSDFSMSSEENQLKLRQLFEAHSSNGATLAPKELHRLAGDLGLQQDMFLRDAHYYCPALSKTGIALPELVRLMDFLMSAGGPAEERIDVFKCLDRAGTGQIQSPEMLSLLKRHLSAGEYEAYALIVPLCYGPAFNYMEVLGGGRKGK